VQAGPSRCERRYVGHERGSEQAFQYRRLHHAFKVTWSANSVGILICVVWGYRSGNELFC